MRQRINAVAAITNAVLKNTNTSILLGNDNRLITKKIADKQANIFKTIFIEFKFG
jgi:hypothetical protein